MKTPCELVRDLLPLYHDGVCSDVSKEIVDAHLSCCAECRKLRSSLNTEIEAEKEIETARPLISMSHRWKQAMKRSALKGIGITVLVFALLTGSLLAMTQWKCIPIDPVAMTVAEIYQLEDGRILYKLEVPAGVWSRTFTFTHCEDGSTYLTPKRSLIELGQQQGWGSLLDSYLMIDVAENNAWAENNGGAAMTKYYIGDPDNYAPLLIWEENMVLQPAPAELEAIYG